MKKSQITAFMLIGLVIVGSFGALYFVNNVVNKIRFNQQIDKIMSDIVQRTPMNLYVTECLDKSFVEGLDLVGKQGGMIYSDQEGTLLPQWGLQDGTAEEDDIYYVEYGGDKINHAILDNIPPPDENYSNTPQYPCRIKFKEGDLPSNEDILCKEIETQLTYDNPCYFRYNIYMHPLNYKQTRLADTCSIPLGKVNTPPLYKSDEVGSSPNISIQRQLENYVANNTKSCVNFTSISKAVGYEIYAGDVNATVSFSDEEVFTNLKFPVVIAVKGRPPVTKFLDFRSDQDIRLKIMYETLAEAGACKNIQHLDIHPNFKGKNILAIDNLDLKFDLESNISGCLIRGTNSTRDIGIDVEKIDAHAFDVFVLTDNNFQLQGNPYVFQFARQNRYPSLDFMTNYDDYENTQLYGQHAYSYGTNPQRYFDYMVPVGDTIVLTPIALDPDGDTVYFKFSGWREDYYSYWNPDRGTPEECSLDPYLCVEEGPPANPHNWTNSNPSWNLNGRVNLKTNGSDVGAHELTVEVYDNQMVSLDRQTLRILVYQWIIPAPTGGHGYDDITDPMKASVEDPYYLDARAAETAVCPDKAFDWHDVYETTTIMPHPAFNNVPWNPPDYFDPGHKLYSGEVSYVSIYKDPCTDTSCTFDIKDPTGAFENFVDADNPPAHTIQLTVKDISCSQQVASETMNVTVYQCLAHDQNSAPYPFCTTDDARYFDDDLGFECADNFFYGNHTCCDDFDPLIVPEHEGGGKFYTVAQDCFNFEAYTCKPETGKEQYPGTLVVGEEAPVLDETRKLKDAVGTIVNIYNSIIFMTDPLVPDIYKAMNQAPRNVQYPTDLKDSDNDIFLHTFKQACSGNRGNACSGPYVDKYEWLLPCADIVDGQDERCQGPCNKNLPGCHYNDNPLEQETCPQGRTDVLPSCYQYNGPYSFEFSYMNNGVLGSDANAVLQNEPGVYIDGACNNLWKQSYSGSGKFNYRVPPVTGTKEGDSLCQAGCDFGQCSNGVHCRKIDDYDGKIPCSDVEGNSPNNCIVTAGTPFFVTAGIRGYPKNSVDPTPPMWGSALTTTEIPDSFKKYHMLPEPFDPWCDGKCFSEDYNPRGSAPIAPSNVPGKDQCMARDYFIVGNPVEADFDGISFVGVDIDTDETWCNYCEYQKTIWYKSGEDIAFGEYPAAFGTENCCGDDANEFPIRSEEYESTNNDDGTASTACCNLETDCIDEGRCYSSSSANLCTENTNCYDTQGGGDIEICSDNEWKDCDRDLDFCEIRCENNDVLRPIRWLTDLDDPEKGEGIDDHDNYKNNGMCCGDDNNEHFQTRKGDITEITDRSCCAASTDCVYENYCYDYDDNEFDGSYVDSACTAGKNGNSGDIEYYCMNSLWENEGDTNQDTCACMEDDDDCGLVGDKTECWEPSGESAPHGEYTEYTNPHCCGDDLGEEFQTCFVDYSSFSAKCSSDDDKKKACCNDPDDCINRAGECVPEGARLFDKLWPGSEVPTEREGFCEGGKWLDPDLEESRCIAVGGGWVGVNQCCGDDYLGETAPDKNYLENFGGITSGSESCCCNGNVIPNGATCWKKDPASTHPDYNDLNVNPDADMICINGQLGGTISDGLPLDGDIENSPYQADCTYNNEANLACSDNNDKITEGICVDDWSSTLECKNEDITFWNSKYYFGCSALGNGMTCDTDVKLDGGVTTPYQAIFVADSICVNDNGNPDCDVDEACDDGGKKSDCQYCGDGARCDNDVSDATFNEIGVCTNPDICCYGDSVDSVGSSITDTTPATYCPSLEGTVTAATYNWLSYTCDTNVENSLATSGQADAGRWVQNNDFSAGECCTTGFMLGSSVTDQSVHNSCSATCINGLTCVADSTFKNFAPEPQLNDKGVCASNGVNMICEELIVAYDGLNYYSGCNNAANGNSCDKNVFTPFGKHGFVPHGICSYDTNGQLGCLGSGLICRDSGDSNYYDDCGCADESPADNSYEYSFGFQIEGNCQDTNFCVDVAPDNVICSLDSDCSLSGECESDCKCECDNNGECPLSYYCDASDRCATLLPDGGSCDEHSDCSSGICDDSEGVCIKCSATIDGLQDDGKCEEECDTSGSSVHARCDEILPFNLQTTSVEGWCHGINGCNDFCTTEIVENDVTVPDPILSSGDKCGCDNPADDGKDCDPYFAGFAGSYDGDVCNAGNCW